MTYVAALHGSVECLRYAHEHGCPWDSCVPWAAATCGSLACLSYVHRCGCPWDSRVTWAAAQCGSVECPSYAHEHGCEWDGLACEAAIKGDRLRCLRYANAHGCPLADPRAAIRAAVGHDSVRRLRHIHENLGHPLDRAVALIAKREESLACLWYVQTRGASA